MPALQLREQAQRQRLDFDASLAALPKHRENWDGRPRGEFAEWQKK